MKRIKKLFSIFLIFLLTFSLSSCTIVFPFIYFPSPFSNDFEYDVSEIERIEIYEENYDKPENETIAYIAPENYKEFISDYNELPFEMWLPLLPLAVGAPAPSWSIRIYLKNNETIYLRQDQDMQFCEDEDWYNFLKKYIGEEQFNANSN